MTLRKHQYAPTGFFTSGEGHEYGVQETIAVADKLIAGYEPQLLQYGYVELPREFWASAYWHGYKVTGAYVYNYSTDVSYMDSTVVLYVNTFEYHPEHDLLRVPSYKFTNWGE